MLSTENNERLTRTGPGTPMGDLFRRFWMPAMLPDELPAPDCPPVRLRLLSEDLVAFRDTSGRVGILAAACPHRRANLVWGRNEEHGLRCVYHGWKFDADGNCVDMPSEPPESNFKYKMTTTAYPAEEWGGLVWVYMGPSELKPPLPHFDWCVEPSLDQHVYKWIQDSNYAQGLEGNIDSTHVSFLHRTFGKTAEYLEYGAPVLSAMETDFGFVYGARRPARTGGFHWRVTPFVMPLYTVIPSRAGRGSGFFVVPMDDEHS